MWITYYKKWITQKSNPIAVKKLKYLGLLGHKGHIQKHIFDGIYYAGEVWSCITPENERLKCVFRIPYDDIVTPDINQEYDVTIEELPNFHTDGIKCYMEGNFKNYDRSKLKKLEEELYDKIQKLKSLFHSTTDSNLKLGIQLYLRRLETPDHITSKEWKLFTNKAKVLDLLNE